MTAWALSKAAQGPIVHRSEDITPDES